MESAFPRETVELAEKELDAGRQRFANEKVKRVVCSNALADRADSEYGFTDCLRTGNYAPWGHERRRLQMFQHNCTTIIPEVFLAAKYFGLNPQIVQFIQFRDIREKKDENEPLHESHFSLIVDVGRKHKFLLDPFFNTSGPIIETGNGFMRIGKNDTYSAKRREFSEMLFYSEQEFAEMMDRLHDPAESLDMLVAGQKIFDSIRTKGIEGTIMLFYDDDSNTVSVRLYAEQAGILGKAVLHHLRFDEEGKVAGTCLDFFYAKEAAWETLVEGRKVASLDFRTAYRLRREIARIRKENNLSEYARIGLAVESSGQQVLEMLSRFRLTDEEQGRIMPMVLARTLYESESPGEEYLYSEEEHDSVFRENIEREIEETDRIMPAKKLFHLSALRLKKLSRNERGRANYAWERYRRIVNEIDEKIGAMKKIRGKNKGFYRRSMDMALFARNEIHGRSIDGLSAQVSERGLDPRAGYIAMVSDFVPFAIGQRKYLELLPFIRDISAKVAARRAKMAGRHITT